MNRLFAALAILATGTAFAADPGAFDWPQWRGPDRTGISKETGLLKDWPKDGPKLLWKIDGLGEGYSTPSISAGKIYLLGTKDGFDHLICLEEKDGKRVWEAKMGPRQAGGNYPGPRGTPTIDNGFAYALSADGTLICAELAKGEIKWQKHLKNDFTGQPGWWVYAESPLIDGDLIIATPGAKDAAIVALKKSSGEVVWKTKVEGLERKPGGKGKKGGQAKEYHTAGYSSVVKTEVGGVKQYVQFLDGGVVGVNAADGKLLWHYEAPANLIANCSTPIVRGDFVFAASAYGTGGGQVKITKDGSDFKAEETYFVKQMQNHHGGMVLVKDHVFGTNDTSLLCLDFKTGKVVWDDRCVGKGSVAYADGHLIVRGEDGRLALVEANPTKYVEKGKFLQPDRSKSRAWPHPVIANGKMYIHDLDILQCYDMKNK